MLYSFLRFLSWLALKIGFGLKVKGRENIPRQGGFILAGNHLSYLDPIVIGVACPRKLNYMAKQELFGSRLSSWFMSAIYVFPVKRNSADLSAMKEAIRRVNNGGGLVLFPEGSRRFEGASAEPQAGVGFLSAKLSVPVIPAFVEGTDKAWPAGVKFPRPAKIRVYFGKQISIERRVPYQDIARQVMDEIRHLSCGALN